MRSKYTLLNGFFDGATPIPVTLVSDWSDKNIYLTSENSAEPGRWHTDRVPHTKEIMDCMSPNSPVTDVIVMKGVQLALTASMLNIMGCYADIAPCPIMYIMPTLDVAKSFSETRVDPMLANSPVLKDKIKPARERDSGNTKFTKKFPGGFYTLPGANSAASLRSKAIRLCLMDEVDAYPLSVDDEGSPVSLAKKRQVTFGAKRKTMLVSTPLMEATSIIEAEYLKTDQCKYFVPCPHCGVFQHLQFAQLKWDKGKPETAKYECEHCEELIIERHKSKMFKDAYWQATAPQNKSLTRRGFHINSLYSPIGWLSWADIASEFEDAQGDVNKMRVFVNTILGETWKEKGDVPEWQNLFNRREKYQTNKPNSDVAFITAGVDVQGDRLELHIMGWCKKKISYSLDYRKILGPPSTQAPWDELAKIVGETWVREDGVVLPLKLMAIDTGGHHTSHVYAFCRRFDVTRVVPIKGSSDFNALMITSPRTVDTTSAGKKIGKMKVWSIGVSMIKSEIYGWLKQEINEQGEVPPGYIHFPEYNTEFFRGITAEQLQLTASKKGHKRYEWVKKYNANEPLDTTVYARAAAAIIGIDRMTDVHFENMISSYQRQDIIKKSTKKKGPSFWD